MRTRSSQVINGVPGPSGEPGLLLLVPRSEALDWDLQDEVASTGRHWMADRQAWWVAAPYASTAVAIVARLNGGSDHSHRGAGDARPSPAPRGRVASVGERGEDDDRPVSQASATRPRAEAEARSVRSRLKRALGNVGGLLLRASSRGRSKRS